MSYTRLDTSSGGSCLQEEEVGLGRRQLLGSISATIIAILIGGRADQLWGSFNV